MKIAILGTRGVPNKYGGFEQFAEYLGSGMTELGHEVTVYNSSVHPYKKSNFHKIKIIRKQCPEKIFGPVANFYYDWMCSKDSFSKDFDIIYHAGYQSSALAIAFFSSRSNALWVTNMDGIEWKRDKWNPLVKWITKRMESLAVKYSDYLISDNIGLKKYYLDKYNVKTKFLAYGADIPEKIHDYKLKKYNLSTNNYYLVIARLEPENNINDILSGYSNSGSSYPIIVVGNKNTKYGKFLLNSFKNSNIRFLGGIYSKNILDALRKHARIYFHGHSVGGTNPSLLEAMAVGANIVAHNNPFNFSVLGNNAIYFNSAKEIKYIIKKFRTKDFLKNGKQIKSIIQKNYLWDKIIAEHIKFFNEILKSKKK